MPTIINRTREEVVQRWVAALRSGEYSQSYAHLRTSAGFCCLGVLCDLNHKDGGAPWGESDDTGSTEYRGSTEMLNHDMKEFIRGERTVIFVHYAELNDNGMTFTELADKIEKELL